MKNKKGLILLQVIVLVAIMAFLASAVVKFMLGRHATVTRAKKTIDAKSLVEACMAQKHIEWENVLPASDTCFIDVEGTPADDTDDVSVYVTVQGAVAPYQVTYTVDYDTIPLY
jgi:type II secretory pathway pseudopilin PulG